MEQDITVNPVASYELRDRLSKILDLIDLERRHAHTHSQRNAYQAVIRHEVEVLQSDIHSKGQGTNEDSDIPF